MAKFNRFGNMNPCKQARDYPYLLAADPFKIIGNTYYVGTSQCSSILIDIGEGFALLDTPYCRDMGLLVHNIYQLGYQLADLKYIIVSHAHIDHYGCVGALRHLTGAKVFMSAVDTEDMLHNPLWLRDHYDHGGNTYELFEVDKILEDGEILELGNTRIKCVLTPGHTVGCMSHFWETEEDGKTYRVGIYGGAGFGALTDENIQKQNLPLTIRDDFRTSIDKVWNEKVDVMLGNHPFHNDTFDKYDRRQSGSSENPFVDPAEWQRYLQELKDCYADFLKMTPEEQKAMFRQSGFMDYMGYRLGLNE